jgi:hypothetical protein
VESNNTPGVLQVGGIHGEIDFPVAFKVFKHKECRACIGGGRKSMVAVTFKVVMMAGDREIEMWFPKRLLFP